MENSTENIIIEKQLIMSSFPVPNDIQKYIKEFLFLDENQYQILKNRKNVVSSLKNELCYDVEIDHWCLWTSTVQLQAVNCEQCGNFLQVGSIYINLPECCVCKC